MGVKTIFTDFASWTTCHGIPHVNSSRFILLKIFWLVVTLGSCGGLIFMYMNVISKFISYPTNIQTSVKFDNINFPQVTFCNHNPIKYSATQTLPTIYYETFAQLFSLGKAKLAGLDVPVEYGLPNTTNELELIAALRTNLGFVMYDMVMNASDLLNASMYSLNELLITSSFGGKYLKNYLGGDGDYSQLTDSTYGNCYSFNYDGSYSSSRAGPSYGYHAVYRVDMRELLPIIEMAGIRLVVTEPKVTPIPTTAGINLKIGFSTAAVVSFTSNQRLAAPYGICTNSGTGYTYFYNGTYNVDGCYQSCYQLALNAKCSCYDPRYPTARGSTLKSCQSDWKNPPYTMYKCMNSLAIGSSWSPVAECNCPRLCQDKTFSVTTSYALWPPKKHTPDECKNATVIFSLYNAKSIAECVSWYSNNTAAVDIYYDRMNYLELVEYAAYPITNLINDMGGNMGLWMGGSVITVVEFLILGALCIVYCCAKRKLKNEANKREQLKRQQEKK